MTAAPIVRVTILRPCHVAGQTVEAGAELDLAPLVALALVDANAGIVLDPAGVELLLAARDAEIRRQVVAEVATLPGQSQESAELAMRELERAGRRRPMGFIWDE